MIDAIIYGRDLGPEGDDFVAEERFDKIRYYLKHGKYPASADRAEKSRLRSAATHYKLLPPNSPDEEERLMLKDKEVVSDPQRQYDIARSLHLLSHGGINKTTATVAEKYHWVRIKDTVSLVIKNCPECKETNKLANSRTDSIQAIGSRKPASSNVSAAMKHDPNQEIERIVNFEQLGNPGLNSTGKRSRRSPVQDSHQQDQSGLQISDAAISQQAPFALMRPQDGTYDDLPLDPQIMEYNSQQLSALQPSSKQSHHFHHHGDQAMDIEPNQTRLMSNDDVEDLEGQLINATSFSGTG